MNLLDVKRQEIRNALTRYDGNKTRAADALGISVRTIRSLVADDPQLREFRVDPNWRAKHWQSIQPTESSKMNTEVQKINEEKFDTRTVVKTLEGLMTKVTEKDCTSETVNAACNCAGRITDLLRLHIEVERMKIKRGL